MKFRRLAVWIPLCLMTTLALADEPQGASQLKDLFAKSDAIGNRSFVIETVTIQKQGDKDRETSKISTVYLIPKDDVILINTDLLWHRSESDRESAWTKKGQEVNVQIARKLNSQAERLGKVAMSNQNVFWFVPTAGNATFLANNFRIQLVPSKEGQLEFTLTLADTPQDNYWNNMKKRGMELTATLSFNSQSGCPKGGKVTMQKDGYFREYQVTLKSSSNIVPDEVAAVPKEVEERLQQTDE